jgi:hypothetical protein
LPRVRADIARAEAAVRDFQEWLTPGTIFEYYVSSNTEKAVHRFTNGLGGAYPDCGLEAVNGILYGATAGGGLLDCSCGTILQA